MPPKHGARFLDRSTPPHILTLILLAGMAALSMNMFLPSLPGMTEYFQTDYHLMQLSVALYLAMNAVLQIVVGPLSDLFGRRPVVMWGNFLFMCATLGCIFAPTAEIFLLFRMGQAVIVTGMVLSRAIVRDIVPTDEAASAIAYVTMGMAIVPMIAPALGGILDIWFGWKATFWAFFIFGCALTWLCWRDLGETAAPSRGSFRRQLRESPELMRSPRFWGYSASAAFASGAFFAYLGGGPFVGDQVFGLTPEWVGILFGAPAIGYLTGNFLSGRFSTRVGISRMAMAGAILNMAGIAVSLLIFLLGAGTAYSFFGFMIFVGLGNGLVIPNAIAGALSVRPHLAGTASGLSGAIMIGGGAALSALAGAMLSVETGAFPLLWTMLATASCGMISTFAVIRRERTLAGA